METISTLQAELSAIQVKLSGIVDGAKAAGRDLTATEVTTIERDSERAIALKAKINGLKNADRMASIHTGEDDAYNGGVGFQAAEAKGFITPASFKSMAREATAPLAKALVAGGSSATPVALNESPLKLATPPANLGILGVVPVVKRDTPTYSYLRQSLRDNNADVVAAGEQKPTSTFTVETVPATLQVVAHLSEYVDSYVLRDNANLEGFLESELRDGIFAKVTALAVAAFAGVTGAQTQAFSDNAMDSLYLGASKASELGYNPDVVLISRATLDAINLAKNADGEYLYRKAEDSRINGLFPVVATGLPADTAIVLDSSKVSISTDKDGILTKWDAITRMDHNEVRALVEGRFQTDILAAPSIVKVAVAGA